MSKKTKIIVWIIVAVLGAALIYVLLSDVFGGAVEKSFTEFLDMIKSGKIQKLYVDAYNWTGYELNAEGKIVETYETVAPSLYNYTDIMALLDKITELGLKLDIEMVDPNAGSVWSSLMPLLGVVLVGGLFFLIMRSAAGSGSAAMSIGKTKTQVQNNLKVRFSDVAGAEEEKEELQEVVEFLKNPKKFSNLGARIPSGILLVGPPGTGKTLFAKAVAGEAGVPFFSVSGSDFVELYVGVGAKRVRDLFEMAKKN